jgi:hypothetical protein
VLLDREIHVDIYSLHSLIVVVRRTKSSSHNDNNKEMEGSIHIVLASKVQRMNLWHFAIFWPPLP